MRDGLSTRPIGAPFFYADSVVTACNGSSPDATQKSLPLAFGVHRAPQAAPAKVLRQIESEAQALTVSIAAGHHKLVYIAARIGKSHTYISLMQSGKRPIPRKLIAPLCAATGTLLLQQYIDLQDALAEVTAKREVERLADMLREAA